MPIPTLGTMDTRELVAVATPIVWRRGYQAGLTVEDREDLLQEVLMKYLHAWPDGQAPANVAAWFETATANAIIDRQRADARRPARTHPHDDGGEDDPVALAIAAARSTRQPSVVAIRDKLLRAVFALIPAEDASLLLGPVRGRLPGGAARRGPGHHGREPRPAHHPRQAPPPRGAGGPPRPGERTPRPPPPRVLAQTTTAPATTL